MNHRAPLDLTGPKKPNSESPERLAVVSSFERSLRTPSKRFLLFLEIPF